MFWAFENANNAYGANNVQDAYTFMSYPCK